LSGKLCNGVVRHAATISGFGAIFPEIAPGPALLRSVGDWSRERRSVTG
jgi:hypothetical protein